MRLKMILFLSIFLSLTVFCALPVFGATITVTNTNDSGAGSFRQAIADAASGDTINFNVTGTITLTTGTLSIGKDLTINGPDSSVLAISGNNLYQVFFISPGVTVSITDLTIENGNNPNGGGIWNQGTLSLSNCIVAHNNSIQGGGINNFIGATLTVNYSTISGNTASIGAGILNFYSTVVTVTNSTFSLNSAGPCIENLGTMTVTNSTFSGNTSPTLGGGIRNDGTMAVSNSTVSGNSALSGGGIYNYTTGTLTVKSTLLANSLSGGNCSNSGTITSQGYNLSDDASCSGFFTVTGDSNGTPSGLDPNGLQDNGGPTQTIALLGTSAAVDAIPVGNCTDTDGNPVAADQRGVSRPQGPACDIGAFELVQNVPFATISAKLRILTGPPPSFTLNATFALGGDSDGVDPLTEDVSLQVGTYSVTIPAGSLKQLTNGKKAGGYAFSGVIEGVTLSLQIAPPSVTGDDWSFKVSATPEDLTGLTNPVTVTITIGDDYGTTEVDAIF